MRPTPVASDARPVPTIAEQLRAARHRRQRRLRATVGVLLAGPAAVLGARLVAGASDGVAGLAASDTASSAPTTSTVPAGLDPGLGTASTTSTPTGLDPGLVGAFERARSAASEAGHELTITSGFRTAQEQAALLDAEIAERGSVEEA